MGGVGSRLNLTKCEVCDKSMYRGYMYMAEKKLRMPDDFEWNGWSRANNYGLKEEDFADKRSYNKARYGRAIQVSGMWRKTDEAKALVSSYNKAKWEERAAKAKSESDTTEVLLLERITSHEDGLSTAELVAGCLNMIARELAKRGAAGIDKLELKDLILISNNLLGLTKAAAAVKKEMDWKPNTVVVNNVSTSKTGGAVGGLKDVIDIRTEKTPQLQSNGNR